MLEVFQKRGSLECLKAAIKKGSVTLGFIGGSVTAGDENVGGKESNWFEFIRLWFKKSYPEVKLTIVNAAIGGTPSLSGLMRAKNELIDTKCDLVFVEYAINDCSEEDNFRSREGLIRKLLEQKRDLLFVYVFNKEMYDFITNDKLPVVVAQFEEIAKRYNISSVWSGLYVFNALKRGELSWESWLPNSGGGVHPEYYGSLYYSKPVIEFLEQEIKSNRINAISCGDKLPKAINDNNFQNIIEIPMDEWETDSTWTKMRELKFPWYKWVMSSFADGAELSFKFTGTMLAANFNFGTRSAKIKFSIDGGEWILTDNLRAWYAPDKDWCSPLLFCKDLKNCEHSFKMKTVYGNGENCKGADCKIFTFVTVR